MIEYLDVLDKDGNKTGAKLPKKEVNEKGLWHRAAHLWIIAPGKKIVISQRSKDKSDFPNAWASTAAGHVSAGEDSATAMVREAQEEIGLKLMPQDLNLLFSYPFSQISFPKGYIHNGWFDVFIAHKDITPEQIRTSEETQAIKFVSVEELEIMTKTPDLMLPSDIEYDRIIKYLMNH